MEVIGIIVLIILAFVFFGLLGWVLKAFGWVFDFLMEGCSTSFGCLFWVFIALFLLLGLLMMWELKKITPLFEFFEVVSYIKGATILFEVTAMGTLVYAIALGVMLGIFDYLENDE